MTPLPLRILFVLLGAVLFVTSCDIVIERERATLAGNALMWAASFGGALTCLWVAFA